MKNIYYVGVYLSERINFGVYGFTSYADCYAEAKDFKEASEVAKAHFETKYKVSVTGTRPKQVKDNEFAKYAKSEQIINLATA